MQEVFVKRKMPEDYKECCEIDCEDCVYLCGNHAHSRLRK